VTVGLWRRRRRDGTWTRFSLQKAPSHRATPRFGSKTGLAFSLVAAGTLVNAVEPFFNWRSRWNLMERTQYRLQRIRDELEYLLVKTLLLM
jgi:hypothetical protein